MATLRAPASPAFRFLLTSLVACLSLSASAQDAVTLTVQDTAAAARAGEYVTMGIPLPRSLGVSDVSSLRLSLDGSPVPAQFQVLARWGAAASVITAPAKWVLVGYVASLPASGSQSLTLDHLGPGPAPATAVSVAGPSGDVITVNTGVAEFEILTSGDFNLLNQVTLGSSALLQPLPADQAIAYAPAGASSIVAGGTPDFTPRATSAAVESAGPLCAVVRIEGSILDATDRALLDFTSRLHFTAGSTNVRVDFTVENNQLIVEGGEGQPTNVHRQGAVNSVHIGSLRLALRLAGAGALTVRTEQEVTVSSPAAPLRLYQDASGTDFWDVYTGDVGWPGMEGPAAPRLQSYCSQRGFSITGGPGVITGDQALGWMSVARAGGAAITAAVRDFWENFPKAIEANPGGTLAVDLFPNGETFRHNLRVGEEKTHSVLFQFSGTAPTPAAVESAARAFDMPLVGRAPAAWYTGSGALGEVSPANLGQWPLYERYTRTAFEPNPDFDPEVDDPSFGNGTLTEAIQRYNFYGWQDFGDLPLDYEAFGPNQAGQMNLKYWYLYGMLLQFCRTSNGDWLNLALPAARHLADIDILHIPDEGPQHWAHGAYFGHSQHDEPGNLNPNRNENSPSVDLFFGVPDLLLAYYLTGDRRYPEAIEEALVSMEAMSQWSTWEDPTEYWDPMLERARANLIFGYIEGYRQTGDSRWLNNLNNIVSHTVDLSGKGWVTAPESFGTAHPDAFLRMFMFNQILWTLGRYLDFLDEYGLPDTYDVAGALEAYGDFVLDHVMVEYEPGRAAHLYEYYMSGEPPDWVELDINNWALVMADALAYAFKYTHAQRFLDAAAMFYATGTIDPQWPGDPPVYIDAKGLVNALNWGLVYMNQAAGGVEGEGEGEGEGEHSADQDGSNTISLSELLRVIQFFNSFGLHCAETPDATEDGYVPGPGIEHSCAPHSSDYNLQDWNISLSELLRLIQFFNIGGYHACPGDGTEDGYCVGPP